MRRFAAIFVLAMGLVSGGVRGDGILYVDDDAPAGGNGLSWATAFASLEDALSAAEEPKKEITQIRLGQGTYASNGHSFVLVDGVALVGGFAGFGATAPELRDVDEFETVLGAAVGGRIAIPDDVSNISLHGLTIDGVLIDLFGKFDRPIKFTATDVHFKNHNDVRAMEFYFVDCTLTRCSFTNHYGFEHGGAIFAMFSTLVANECYFANNSCRRIGGAVYLGSSSGTFVSTIFEQNGVVDTRDGGAIFFGRPPGAFLEGTRLRVSKCRFIDNGRDLLNFGGAITGHDYPVTIEESDFFGNRAYTFSVLHHFQSNCVIRRCRFIDNHSTLEGVASFSSTPTLVTNCLFFGNTTQVDPSAIRTGGDDDVDIQNTTVVGNVSDNGIAIGELISPLLPPYSGALTIEKVVVWGNRDSGGITGENQISVPIHPPNVSHSCVQNISPEWNVVASIDADPRFRNPLGDDGIAGTEDDDFRLTAGSPCLDAGDNSVLGAEDLLDLDGRARRIDSPLSPDVGVGDGPIVDMGAFEFQAGDVNDDFVVSLADFEGWKACVAEPSGVNCLMLDFDGDGDVDLVDWSGLQVAFDGE